MKFNAKMALRAAKYLAAFAAMFVCASCSNQLTATLAAVQKP